MGQSNRANIVQRRGIRIFAHDLKFYSSISSSIFCDLPFNVDWAVTIKRKVVEDWREYWQVLVPVICLVIQLHDYNWRFRVHKPTVLTRIQNWHPSIKPSYLFFNLSLKALSENSFPTVRSKSDILHPLPAYLLRLCLDDLIPVITKLINAFLSSASVSEVIEHAILKPFLKKVVSVLSSRRTTALFQIHPFSQIYLRGWYSPSFSITLLPTACLTCMSA